MENNFKEDMNKCIYCNTEIIDEAELCDECSTGESI
jgi:hypothetical protein